MHFCSQDQAVLFILKDKIFKKAFQLPLAKPQN